MTAKGCVRLSSPGDKPAVEKLLRAGFGDEEEFLRAFFAHLYDHCDTLLSLDGEDIAAMAMLIPCRIIQPSKPPLQARYLYALTTLPAFRSRGHAQQLLDFARARCERVFLHAADDSLFGLYARRGWRSMMHALWQETVPAGQSISFTACDGDRYHALRTQFLQQSAYVEWEQHTCRFLSDLLRSEGGGLYQAENAAAAILEKKDDCLYIAEALGSNASALIQSLIEAYGCQRACLLTACSQDTPASFPMAQGAGALIPEILQLSFVFL